MARLSVLVLLPLLFVALTCCLSAPAAHAARVFTSPLGLTAAETAPQIGDWVRGERADPSELVTLTIGVRLRAVDKLESEMLAVSDPQNARYGQHLSHEAVQSMVAPDASSVQAVMSWLLADGGVSKSAIEHSATLDWISATLTFEQAERLLNARYHRFTHAKSGVVLHRCASYELPDSVAPYIDVIGPTTRFPMSSSLKVHRPASVENHQQRIKEVKEKLANAFAGAAAGASFDVNAQPNDACQADQGFIVTPACLSVLYGINNFTAVNPSTSVAVTGYLEQYVALSDLKLFFQMYQPTSVNRIPNIVGPNDQTQPGDEASLDIQYSMSVAQGANATFWYTAGRQPKNPDNEPFLVFLQSLDADSNPPLVISTSYGDYENTVDFDYSVRVNAEFVKAGARGISILFSSGDSGVGGSDGTCTSFVPNYPATSPYVTAVGSTQGYPETAAYFSSGGFSNYFPLQPWQTDAVKTYLALPNASLPASSYYNVSGRAFPDVSTQGVSFIIVDGGATEPVDGTSCSSPTFAGVVALLNDQRQSGGKSSLGFLNQLFYQNPSVFYDVTSGNNPGCNTNGFQATVGWDPVTGLGTPNFPKLSALVKLLP